MRASESYFPTLREIPAEDEVISHRLMLRAGLVRKLSAGTYSYLPMGLRVLLKVTRIIREEMANAGALEVLMPSLQPADVWKKSGRYDKMGPEMIRFRDRHGKETVLGPTHEEIITSLISGELRSYRDLPKTFFQIQTKFRDEARPRFGVIRTSEFIMKDAYSFHRDEKSLDETYKKMYGVYTRIFHRCGMNAIPIEADTGVMGGDNSHEFMIPASCGEDFVVRCKACSYAASMDRAAKKMTPAGAAEQVVPRNGDACPQCAQPLEILPGIEVGHIFMLGTKYSTALEAMYLDEDGKQKVFIMGCYGIGVTRIIPSIIEANNDEAGIRWPVSVAPYTVVVIPVNPDAAVKEAAETIYQDLRKSGIEVLLDDRDLSGGVKMKDADLIGFPLRVVVSNKTLQQSAVELKVRTEAQFSMVPLSEIVSRLITASS